MRKADQKSKVINHLNDEYPLCVNRIISPPLSLIHWGEWDVWSVLL